LNKARRERLRRIVQDLRDLADEEEQALDNLPENLQDSSLSEELRETWDDMDEALGLLEPHCE